MAEITTIKLDRRTKERLDKLRLHKRESYDEVVQRILNLLNICRSDPERAQERLEEIERRVRRGKKEDKIDNKN